MLQQQSKRIETIAQCCEDQSRSAIAKPGFLVCALIALSALSAACQSIQPDVVSKSPAVASAPQPSYPSATAEAFVDSVPDHSEPALKLTTDQAENVSGWANQIHARFNDARDLVELELDTDLDDIKLMLVSDKPINREVALETRRLVHNQFESTEFADRFLHQVMQSQSGTYAALFTARLGAVMVSRSMLESFERSLPVNPEIRDAALLTLLIHELVHAADDKRYHIHKNRALSFRASFAQSATFEGHAQWVTRNICQRVGCISGLDALDNFMFSRNESSNQLTQPVEAISRNVLEYSYVEGERFIRELALRENGASLIDNILAAPPHDPVQILAPDTYPDVERDRRNDRLIHASRDIDHPWVTAPWVGVETSPLKGINLRSEPMRRKAAVDGFTRLIQGMVAMQFYDQHSVDMPPMEVTLLQAESAPTAKLFASTLHDNTYQADAKVNDEPLQIKTGAGTSKSLMDMHLYRTQVDIDNTVSPYRTAIGVSGPYVVQIAGNTRNMGPLEDYAIRVLLNLQLSSL